MPLILRGLNDYFNTYDWHTNLRNRYKSYYELSFFFVSDAIPLGF